MVEKRKMILVEDSLADVMLVRLAVEETGVPLEIVHLADGEEVFQYLSENPAESIGFILLDLNIPKASGIDILIHRTKLPDWKTVPVILYSSSTRPEDIQQAIANGANAYVLKPVDFEQFNRTIQHLAVFWGELNQLIPTGMA